MSEQSNFYNRLQKELGFTEGKPNDMILRLCCFYGLSEEQTKRCFPKKANFYWSDFLRICQIFQIPVDSLPEDILSHPEQYPKKPGEFIAKRIAAGTQKTEQTDSSENRISQLNQEIRDLRDKNATLKKEKSELEGNLSRANIQNKEVLRQDGKAMEKKEAELEKVKKRVSQLEQERKDLESGFEKRTKNLRDQNDTLRRENETLKQEIVAERKAQESVQEKTPEVPENCTPSQGSNENVTRSEMEPEQNTDAGKSVPSGNRLVRELVNKNMNLNRAQLEVIAVMVRLKIPDEEILKCVRPETSAEQLKKYIEWWMDGLPPEEQKSVRIWKAKWKLKRINTNGKPERRE